MTPGWGAGAAVRAPERGAPDGMDARRAGGAQPGTSRDRYERKGSGEVLVYIMPFM